MRPACLPENPQPREPLAPPNVSLFQERNNHPHTHLPQFSTMAKEHLSVVVCGHVDAGKFI